MSLAWLEPKVRVVWFGINADVSLVKGGVSYNSGGQLPANYRGSSVGLVVSPRTVVNSMRYSRYSGRMEPLLCPKR